MILPSPVRVCHTRALIDTYQTLSFTAVVLPLIDFNCALPLILFIGQLNVQLKLNVLIWGK